METNIVHAPASCAGEPVAPVSDAQACQCGALQDFLAANYNALRRKLAHYLGCSDMASECLHEVWLRLAQMELRTLVLNPEAYVYRMACNAALDRLRSNRAGRYSGDAESEFEQLFDPAPGPETVAELRSEVAAMEEAMERLPYRHLAVLLSLRIEQMSRQDVARRYGISLRSVDTALRQSVDYCAQYLGRAARAESPGTGQPIKRLRLQEPDSARGREASRSRYEPMLQAW